MAVPVIEGFTSATGNAAADLTLTKPSGVATGDLLLILAGSDNTNSGTVLSVKNPSSGFTSIAESGDANSDVHVAAWWRIADGTESSTEDISDSSGNGSTDMIGYYLRISGVTLQTGLQIDQFDSAVFNGGNSSANGFAQTITKLIDGLAICLVGTDGSDLAIGLTSGSEWSDYNADRATSNASLLSSGRLFEVNGTTGVSVGWSYAEIDSSVSTSVTAPTWSGSTSDGWAVIQLIINSTGIELSGTVTLGGSAVSGAPVVAVVGEDTSMTNASVAAVTTTDVNGDYNLTYIPNGTTPISVIYCVYDDGSNTYTAPLHVIWA